MDHHQAGHKILQELGLLAKLPRAMLTVVSSVESWEHDKKRRDWLEQVTFAARTNDAWMLLPNASHGDQLLTMLSHNDDKSNNNNITLGLVVVENSQSWRRERDMWMVDDNSLHAQCPGLSHYILLESDEDAKLVQDALMDMVSSTVMVLGRPESLDGVLQLVARRWPTMIVKTSETNEICGLLERMQEHAEQSYDASVNGVNVAASIDVTHLAGDNPTIAAVLESWPHNYTGEHVMLLDAAKTEHGGLQKSIQKHLDMTCVIEQEREHVIREAEHLLGLIQTASKQQKRCHQLYHCQWVGTSLAAVIASVVYTQFFDAGMETSIWNWCLYACTVLLPLYMIIVDRQRDKADYAQNHGALERAAIHLESETLLFQARVGVYHSMGRIKDCHDTFQTKFRAIWMSVNSILPHNDAPLAEDVDGHSLDLERDEDNKSVDVEAPPNEMTPLRISQRTDACESIDSHSVDDSMASYLSEKTFPFSRLSMDHNKIKTGIYPTIYIRDRLNPQLHKMKKDLARMQRFNSLSKSAVRLSLTSSCILALFSLHWCTPILLSFTMILGSERESRDFDRRLVCLACSSEKLEHTQAWWFGLCHQDRQQQENKDRFLLQAEAIIVDRLCSLLDDISSGLDSSPIEKAHTSYGLASMTFDGVTSPEHDNARKERARQVGNAVTDHVRDMGVLSDKVKAITEQVNGLVNSYIFDDVDMSEAIA